MKKRRKFLNLYNVVIILCIAVISVSLYIVLNKDENLVVGIKTKVEGFISGTKETVAGIFDNNDNKTKQKEEKKNTNTNDKKEKKKSNSSNRKTESIAQEVQEDTPVSNEPGINENEAKEIVLNEFIKLGEEGITVENLAVRGILRGGEKYYLVSSEKNSAEVKIATGKVERINNNLVK